MRRYAALPVTVPLVVAFALFLIVAACRHDGEEATTTAAGLVEVPGGGVSVSTDPSDLIRSARFIEWEDLPAVAQGLRSRDSGYHGVAQVLPGSEPRRLYIAVWHNTCQPIVTIAAPDPSGARLAISISGGGQTACGDLLKMWPLEVILTRDIDPARVVTEVTDSRWP